MKLVEALRSLQLTPVDARPFPIHLVCGCTPLHLQTFLAAHVQGRAPGRRAGISSGLYGDCLGNLQRLATLEPVPESAVLVLEWADLDPRLGIRSAGGWRPSDLPDIVATVRKRGEQFGAALARAASRVPLCLGLPALPLPPVSFFPGGRAGAFELELRAALMELGARAAKLAGVAVLDPQHLDRVSPLDQRRDVTAELATGFPYSLGHASAFAQVMAELVAPAPPKKGLITDLDDTLWRGLVGEVGARGVSWDLDHKSHAHALYQQMLASLAEAGVLVAVASKNDPEVVKQAFGEREELHALRDVFFPVEVSWGPKSIAVGRILDAWNISADSVVFVDDSPLELGEVQSAWPELTTLRFPKENDTHVFALLEQLRNAFGRATLSAEDALRSQSLQAGERFHDEASNAADARAFLSQIDAELTLDYGTGSAEPRVLELINKTNQFNLNGRRYTEGDWLAYLRAPSTCLTAVSYKDKFGSLGTISVIAGTLAPTHRSLSLDAWVLSCRAFSRRIEYACLRALFARFELDTISFDFLQTAKNGPLVSFLGELFGRDVTGPESLSRADFENACPPLDHRLKEIPNV